MCKTFNSLCWVHGLLTPRLNTPNGLSIPFVGFCSRRRRLTASYTLLSIPFVGFRETCSQNRSPNKNRFQFPLLGSLGAIVTGYFIKQCSFNSLCWVHNDNTIYYLWYSSNLSIPFVGFVIFGYYIHQYATCAFNSLCWVLDMLT